MAGSVKKLPVKSCTLPKILPNLNLTITGQCQLKEGALFNLFKPHFAALASIESLKLLRAHCIEIDISKELEVLTHRHSLEITVPALGITDLLKSPLYSEKRLFANPIAINGFGAKSSSVAENNYPLPEFLLITDIVGNQFEIVVGSDGSFEIPDDGTGLFSLISTLTFIYSEKQIIQGQGFENLRNNGIDKNKLLLLGPEESIESFELRICVTHINECNQRIVDTIRTVNVTYPEIYKHNYQIDLLAKTDDSNKLNISLAFKLMAPVTQKPPIIACVTVDDERKFELNHPDKVSLPNQDHGWLQDPINANLFTKHIGLSNRALNLLVREIYSEYDFIKDYLRGDKWVLQQKGYNNFLLMPEAWSRFYDIIVHDIVHHRISADLIFSKVSKGKLATLELSMLPASFHDSIVLSHIQSELAHHQLDTLKSLFYPDKSSSFVENFNLFTSEKIEKTPQISVDILHQYPFVEINQKLSQQNTAMLDMGSERNNYNPWQDNGVHTHIKPNIKDKR